MTILSLAEVKAHLSELVGRVNSQHERVTVTVHGKPSAVLIATEDLESPEETIAVLSDADTLSRLAASEAELARGEGESEEHLPEAFAFAAHEFIVGALLDNPRRVGRRLQAPLDDRQPPSEGTYRVIYRVDDAERKVTVLDVAHRRDAYRTNR